jgi:hypothetical protein
LVDSIDSIGNLATLYLTTVTGIPDELFVTDAYILRALQALTIVYETAVY